MHPHEPTEAVHARIAWLTVSDTRVRSTDASAAAARKLIESAGHQVVDQQIVPDEPDEVRARVSAWLADATIDLVLVSGGTGISRRDRSYEALAGLLDQRLDGYGELFRKLSYEQVGSKALLSRAIGGIAAGKPLFLMPGSVKAVELALSALILPELAHLLAELAK